MKAHRHPRPDAAGFADLHTKKGHLLLGRVGTTLLAEANNSSDESAVVLDTFVSTALRLLLLVLLLHFRGLPSDLPRTGEGSVDLTHGFETGVREEQR